MTLCGCTKRLGSCWPGTSINLTTAGIWNHLGEPHGLKLAECHILLAECRYHHRDFLLSLDTFWKALWLFRGLGLEDRTALPYRRIGDIFFFWGNYDKALKAYEWSLSVNRKAGSKEEAVRDQLYIAGIYRQWGLFTKSSELLQTAQQEAEELRSGVPTAGLLIADVLAAMGDACIAEEDPQGALAHYRKAYDLIRDPEDAGRLQLLLHSIGRAYQASENYLQAEKCYSESMRITGYLHKSVEKGLLKIDLGKLYRMTGDCEKAFSLLRSTGFEREINAYEAEAYDNLGNLLLEEEDYTPAVFYLTESVRIKEKLRLTASGKTRRDYLESQLHTYESLVTAHIRRGKPKEAFDTSELARAKFLTEQISVRSDGNQTRFEGIHFFQNRLSHKCAVLSYANIRTGRLVFMEADKNGVNTLEVNIADYLREVPLRFPRAAEDGQGDRRGLTFDVSKEKSHEESFESIISYYRYLLTRPSGSRTEQDAREYLGKWLCLLLIPSVEQMDEEELIIIPDGILAYLPFETLIMPDGRYLVERFRIRYIPSLTVLNLLSNRSYEKDRKPFLGFGGAVYSEGSYHRDMSVVTEPEPIQSQEALYGLQTEIFQALHEKRSLRNAYQSLGFTGWGNLPGTLAEILSIAKIIPGSEIHTGLQATEETVKSLSDSGRLARYRVLHFATHGLVVPEIPELSALVLSLLTDGQNGEDGYLSMQEIAELDIRADFVNLSACETGLGRIYGGEGVVGLTQSFLVAGANGLSVSLWQVADESTMEFMVGLYRLVYEKGLPFDRAVIE